MRSGVAPLCAAAAAIAAVTALERDGRIPIASLAPTPASFDAGRVWLVATSVLVADRPAVASIAGLVAVGAAALTLADARVLWLSAAVGHLGSAVVVYAALALLDTRGSGALTTAETTYDYGTSAVIAAWVGVLAFSLWWRDRRLALALCAASGLVGWILHPGLTVLDTEHLVALAAGVAVAGYGRSWALHPGLEPAPRH
jgi:hypothetical protein